MKLYHIVPEDMDGTVLYPLNILKSRLPKLYAHEAKKYTHRMHVMDQKVIPLDCLWNDVLHLSPVHPRDVKKALQEAGFAATKKQRFFVIDFETLEPELTTIYLYQENKPRPKTSEDFTEFTPENLAKYALIPQETRDYYKRIHDAGKRPFLYYRIPHVLYKGSIETKNLPIIEV